MTARTVLRLAMVAVVRFAFVALLAVGTGRAAPAQSTGATGYDDAATALALLGAAEPGELAVVCEHMSRRRLSLGKVTGTPAERIERLAAAFDYAVDWAKPNAAVLRKRFKAPGERPQFVLAELKAMADRVLAAQPEPAGHDAALDSLAASLTPPQVQALESGGRLPIGALDATQRAAVARAVAAAAAERTARAWRGYRECLDQVGSSVLEVHGSAEDAAIPAHRLRGWFAVRGPADAEQRIPLGEWAECEPVPDEPPPPAAVFGAPGRSAGTAPA